MKIATRTLTTMIVAIAMIGIIGTATVGAVFSTPFEVGGHVYYLNATRVSGANVVMTNLNTNDFLTCTTDINGAYVVSLGNMPSGHNAGDIIQVTAIYNGQTGTNSAPRSKNLSDIPQIIDVTVGYVDTVTRDIPASVCVGESITVNLVVDVETGVAYYAIDEIVPSGWTVTSVTGGGDYTADPGHIKWAVTSGAANKTYSYTVDVPTDASGAYTFGGTYMFEGMADTATILGDTTLTISEYDSADTDHDCVVSMSELIAQIGSWKSGEVVMMELMTSIGRWKLGSEGYCGHPVRHGSGGGY